jgi:hypothetical protein
MSKLAVLTPYRSLLDPAHEACRRKLYEHRVPHVYVEAPHCVDMARSYLVENAIDKTEAEVFLWIDSDIIFDVNEAVAMCDHLIASDYDILGAAYSTRMPGGKIVGNFKEEVKTVEFFRDGLYPADMVGTGFTAMRRSAFQKVSDFYDMKKVPCRMFLGATIRPFFAHIIDETGYWPEDFSFCKRAVAAGCKIGIDAMPRIYHSGNYWYGLEDIANPVERFRELTVNVDHVDIVPVDEKSSKEMALSPK